MFWNSDKKRRQEKVSLQKLPETKWWQEGDKSQTKDSQNVSSFYINKFDSLRTAISEGTEIEGKLSFDRPVKIDGALQGEVLSSEDVVIGPSAEVKGDLKADTVIVFGKVHGRVSANEKLILFQGSHVDGQVDCRSIAFSDGAYFNGRCSTGERAA